MFQRLAIDRGAILFDPELVDAPVPRLFDRRHWQAEGALTELAGGRGSIHFIDDGRRHWALRRYLRGGVPALVSRKHYLYLGEERTRSFRELRLLDALRRRGLPVPMPVAAIYRRALLTYVAELITERIVGARSLSELLATGAMDDVRWAAIGRCLRRFHDAGVHHADLNAQNILLDPEGKVWLLDFDRGRERSPGAWRERALDRLARSLAKVDVARGDWQGGFALLRIAHDG
jgi:3-deoxy-D-manno-octulosonic acid kinase